MTQHQSILDIYASISVKTGEMLDAAINGDWDKLIALEQDCRALIEILRLADSGSDKSTAFLQRRGDFIRKVLADDAEIRKYTEPWMTKIQIYLGNARREQQLQRAYETDHG